MDLGKPLSVDAIFVTVLEHLVPELLSSSALHPSEGLNQDLVQDRLF